MANAHPAPALGRAVAHQAMVLGSVVITLVTPAPPTIVLVLLILITVAFQVLAAREWARLDRRRRVARSRS
ncbi:hypothetical protein [Cellulomonas sp. PhB143]|uniref:hypothetical protein n=1 Tax=Cellulomonas sp. PhB143 TaxID=2485186 RepID=UPI000F49B0D8|nr:hypothetical protein [Cellulomonas sp. PhB143]